MKNAFTLPILLSFLIFSCQQKASQESNKISEDFVTYPIDIKTKPIEFNDLVESLELVGFEESDESLLKPDVLIYDYQEGYVIIDERKGTVYLFNTDGTFKSKFNHKGQGPEEYPSMQHSRYRDGLIETFVNTAYKVMQYDLAGNYIQSLTLPYQAAHVLYFDQGYLLGMGNQVELDSINHDIVFADSQMKPYAFAMPFDKPNGVPLAGPTNEFRVDGDKVLFNPFWSDSVYQISDDVVKPYMRFDFGEDWLWDELELTRGFNTTTINGKVWGYTWVMGEERIEINYMTDFELPPGIGYIDRRTKEFFKYDLDWSERKRLPYVPLRFEGNKLLAMFLADDLNEMIEAVGQENVIARGFLSKEQILKSENPVLAWIKFK